MPFFVYVPICFSWVLCIATAGNNRNSAAFLNPANKLVAVIAFIGKNQLSC